MNAEADREAARSSMASLVARYLNRESEHEGQTYSEAQARLDFIDQFLMILGWDVSNAAGKPHSRRDVIVERSTADSADAGRPDYVLRVSGEARIVVEAKRPSTDLVDQADPATQVRRYGYTMSLPAACLTNFATTVIFDGRVEPKPDDEAYVARIPGALFTVHDYVDRFDELWDYLAHQSVDSPRYLEVYDFEMSARGTSPIDQVLLSQLRRWRVTIAEDLAQSSAALGAAEIGRLSQRVLNALLFLRSCEDRGIEPYERLRQSVEAGEFEARLAAADKAYNAGLFVALVDRPVSAPTLRAVVDEMYWPKSPFVFSVIEPEFLAAVYEQFLGEGISLRVDRTISLEVKPELLHNQGAVPTPPWLIGRLVEFAFAAVVDGSAAAESVTILDPACGSGGFLLSVYEKLLAELEANGKRASLEDRSQLAARALFGVDIDPEAAEVCRLSLLLAILDDEEVDPQTANSALPDLRQNVVSGNSLIDTNFDTVMPDVAADVERRAAVAPFDWAAAFPSVVSDGGFSIVVTNPPYARIQVLANHLPDQLEYFQDEASGYQTARSRNFDEYMLFVERCIQLARPGGAISVVVPSRFMTSLAGETLRELILSETHIDTIVHFGEAQVFSGRSTYTCLLVATKSQDD